MRNSWAIDRPLTQPFNDLNHKSSIMNNYSIAAHKESTVDTVSMNISRDLTVGGCVSNKGNQYPSIDRRNKYNTLTPAEAKKMKRFLNAPTVKSITTHTTTRYQPTRTASVLHKPRAPPILVPNDLEQQTSQKQLLTNHHQLNNMKQQYQNYNDNLYESVKQTTTNGTRCASACSNRGSSYRDQRHSINYGQLYATNRMYSTNGQASNNNNNNNNNSDNNYNNLSMMNGNNRCSLRVSPSDSETNLSFRSSLDVMDSAYGSDRLQTLSIDLGNPTQHMNGYNNDDNRRFTMSNAYPINGNEKYSHDSCSQDLNKLSDDSYSSAKSHQSECTKYNNHNVMSKNSLSSSTSKVFQNHLSNLKKFFRHMPIRRSFIGSPDLKYKQTNAKLEGKQDLSESISQICLNRSQSPPVCPPPPRELKSMSYMETNSVNYSNYDEFTKARNHQTSTLLRNSSRNCHEKNMNSTTNSSLGNDNDVHPTIDNNNSSDYSEASWQLQSLPISYERNLTTVFEEKQNLSHIYRQTRVGTTNGFKWAPQNYDNSEINSDNNRDSIRPPSSFDDNLKNDNQNRISDCNPTIVDNLVTNKNLSTSSASLATTTDSVLDYQRQINTSFKFSYSQPDAYVQDKGHGNNGLPPKMPINNEQQTPKQQQFSTNNHSSSNNSLTNGKNNSDQKSFSIMDNNSIKSLCDQVDYGIMNGLDNDGDATILSDTSTLHGDSNNMVYVNKCAELERTVESLKNKLITKEKEMTELQLKQWSADYLISQLKSTVVKLEKENAQMKALVVKYNKLNLS